MIKGLIGIRKKEIENIQKYGFITKRLTFNSIVNENAVARELYGKVFERGDGTCILLQKLIEKAPPKKEVVKEAPQPVKVTPPKEKAKEPEKPKKAEEAKAATPAEIKANAAAEKARADQLARLRAAAGAEGGSGGQVGSSVGGGGNAPPAYADKVRRKIKPLIVFNPESITGNPAVVVLVDLAPDGAILKRGVITSSGIPSWDQAVLQALDRAETFPKDDNGVIPMRQMKLTFKPKD